MSDARDVIAATKRQHVALTRRSTGTKWCLCGVELIDRPSEPAYPWHLADAILAALDANGLTITTTGEQP